MDEQKLAVQQFWDAASCGEVYAVGALETDQFNSHSKSRYELEPYIAEFAQFDGARDRDVLEIGVGMGADHIEWARQSPRSLTGIDLTPRAIEWTQRRLATFGLTSRLMVADAEQLPFDDNSFDIVYSWGVLHHSPDTRQAFSEVYRVLRPGGTARIMIYNYRSIVGYMLWLRYALAAGHPRRSLAEVYANHLESPGTKAFTPAEAAAMASGFTHATIRAQLSFGDLLKGEVGQQHRSRLLTTAKRLWPRFFIERFLPKHGLMLLIQAVK